MSFGAWARSCGRPSGGEADGARPGPFPLSVSRRTAGALLLRAILVAWIALAILSILSDASLAQAPPSGLQVADTPNDDGGSLTLRWSPSPDDAGPRDAFAGYAIYRAVSKDGPWEKVGEVTPRTVEFVDASAVEDGVPYWYRVGSMRPPAAAAPAEDAADLAGEEPVRGAEPVGGVEPVGGAEVVGGADPVGGAEPPVERASEPHAAGPAAGPVVSSAQWFHTGRINSLIAVLVLSGLIIVFIERARSGKPIFIRKIAGLDAVDEAVGRATEMGRKVLFVPGTMDMDNVQTLAGIAILGRVARVTAQYETPLEVPVSRSLVMVACRETVKESYLAEGRPDSYSDDRIYYLTDDQFGYAAAIDGIMVREKPATIFMQGAFYAESLILAETGNSIGAIQIAGTAQPSQLPFFVAACDYTLIGEELFVAGAYLSREPRQLGSLKGQDIGKAIILVLLLVGVIVQSLGVFDFASLFEVQ